MNLKQLEAIKERVLSDHNMADNHKAPRVLVGMGSCGISAGAAEILALLQDSLREEPGVTVTGVGCLGLCWMEPVVQVKRPGQEPLMFGQVTTETAGEIVKLFIS